jgi:hypothetical protein
MDGLTPEEERAIASLKRLSKKWPRSLTLASMDGSLHVIRTGDEAFSDGDGAERQDGIIADIHGIPNTGGGW